MQRFRVKKSFREGHERIWGPGKFPENEQPKESEGIDPNGVTLIECPEGFRPSEIPDGGKYCIRNNGPNP